VGEGATYSLVPSLRHEVNATNCLLKSATYVVPWPTHADMLRVLSTWNALKPACVPSAMRVDPKKVVVCGCRSGEGVGVCMRVSVGVLGQCCAWVCDIMRAPQKTFEVSAEWRLARCSAFATRTRCAAMASTQNSQARPSRCSDRIE
jgi:hypothetical protein